MKQRFLKRFRRTVQATEVRWAALILALMVGVLQVSGAIAQVPQSKPFEVALIGDSPYTLLEEQQYPNLIADINRSAVAFVIHDGDIQSSLTPCTDEFTLQRRSLYQGFRVPFIFVPGDNEWTDCHRTGGDPLVRLSKLREIFFNTDQSLGQSTLLLERQSQSPQYRDYKENVRWRYGSVLFVGLHVVGSNNNLGRTPEMDREYKARNQANLAWLQSSFALAQQQSLSGVMVVMQANPGFDLPPERRTGYNDTIAALRTAVMEFGKPVVLVHGDSHYFRIDKPLTDTRNNRLLNFTRVETFGTPDMHWVKASIDPKDPNLFRFEAVVVQKNVNA